MRRLLIALLAASTLASGVPAWAGPDDVTSVLQQAVSHDGVPGAVAVVREGGAVRQFTAGFADVATRSPFVPRIHVRAASITKTFVSTVVLQLVASGDVELDAAVAQYLPGRLPGGITVRHLLRHQSGLAEYFNPGDDPDTSGAAEPSGLVRNAVGQPLRFAPGSGMAYTNTNYLIAGELIAAVTGRSAEQEITSRILVPLGLADSYFPSVGDTGLAVPFASGYEVVDGRSVDETSFPASLAGMSGALISTGEDLSLFVTALLSGRLVSSELLDEMMETVPQPGTDVEYGLGLASFRLSCGVTLWGHGGDVEGYHSLMVQPLEPAGAPALSVTFTQSTDVEGWADDPRSEVAEALYC